MFKIVLVMALLALASAANLPVQRLDGRIVGGVPVNIVDFPYQVYVQYNTASLSISCGGSIIANKYITTAAHCTEMIPKVGLHIALTLKVRAGSSQSDSGGVVIPVRKIYQHAKYNSGTTDYDITILELMKDLIFGDTIKPIGLPAKNQVVADGSDVVVSGWGTLTEGGTTPTRLQAVAIKIINRDVCKSQYGQTSITNRMICAGVSEGGKDTCQGDSGGPLVFAGRLTGITSWGTGCARPGVPGVYTNVADPSIRDYIKASTGL